jgi:hypothetical protein
MADYLNDVGRGWRIIGILGLVFIFLICGAMCLVMGATLVLGVADKGTPVWLAVVFLAFFGALTFFSGWMLVRVLSRTRAANGVTAMPTWCIELFGVVFSAGIIWGAVVRRDPLVLVPLFGIVAAMVFVRRSLKRRVKGGSDEMIES